jgi:hypothetical protein
MTSTVCIIVTYDAVYNWNNTSPKNEKAEAKEQDRNFSGNLKEGEGQFEFVDFLSNGSEIINLYKIT